MCFCHNQQVTDYSCTVLVALLATQNKQKITSGNKQAVHLMIISGSLANRFLLFAQLRQRKWCSRIVATLMVIRQAVR